MPNMRVTHMLYTDAAAPPTPAFIFTAVTTGLTEDFALPLEASGTYNCNVDWGDTTSDVITVWNQAETTHTYAVAGTYVVVITGVITGWRFNGNAYSTKIYEVREWGPLRLGDSDSYFYHCPNLTIIATDVLDLTGTTTLKWAFDSCSSLTSVPSMDSWDVSNITDMDYMLLDATLFNQDIGSWDVSNVTDTAGMFEGAIAFNQDISSWITSSVDDMSNMFSGATLFNQNIGGWNVSSATDMLGMFRDAIAFNQDISSWNVGLVTDMDYMFYGATLFNQNIGGWNTGSVTTTEHMFEDAIAFDQDLSGWDITSLLYALNMFTGIALSTANYNALLVGWEGQVEKPNVTFSGGNSTYNAGAPATAKAALQTNGWIITDGGQV